MKYNLTEEYFKTDLFQRVTQEYFDTVLNGILNYKEIIPAKGLFIVNGEVKRDYYDMPYHIHILNGLILALLIYEKYLIKLNLIEYADAEKYVKTFILGYTFHDANKLTGKEKWEEALIELDKMIEQLNVNKFFAEFYTYRNDVYFLALATENRSSILANQFKVALEYKHLNEILAEFCHFADGVATIQELDGVEVLYKEILKMTTKLSNIIDINISYIKLFENPYTLLSQNLMNTAKNILVENGREIFYIMRDGFIFFGDDLKENEKLAIFRNFKNDDLDIQKLVKIDAQQFDLSSVISIGIDKILLDDIIDKKQNSFLLLSPNGPDKIQFFDDFVKFSELLIQQAGLPIITKIQNSKLYLYFADNASEENPDFVKIFSFIKMQWLNGKSNKAWEKDFKEWTDKNEVLPIVFESEFQVNENEMVAIRKFSDVKKYFEAITKSTSAILKTYIAIFKTLNILNSFDEVEQKEEYIENQYKEIETGFAKGETVEGANSLLSEFYKKYFTFKGNKDFSFLNEYLPVIPEKKNMCAFTAQNGTEQYKDSNAFGMNARGFSNRTVASLKNEYSHVSRLFAEENKLRKSAFDRAKSNNVVYYDFFETTLDIDKNIINAVINSKNYKITEKSEIQFTKSIKFQYNLNNLEFIEMSDNMKDVFYFVWKHLLFVKNLGIRSYITGIMSPYRSHKEVFVYENAPKFIKDLGWDRVRLIDIDMVMDERDLLYSIGARNKSMDTGLVLNYAETPNSIFKAFYQYAAHNDDTQTNMIAAKITKFINKYPFKIKGMTVIEKLVDIALQIDSSAKSGSEETWLIRSALDFLRKNVKEKLSKEDTIQQIAGNIYKTLRQGYTDTSVIESFAKLVYVELYENEWHEKLPTLNRQKDWIYQFGFVFKQKTNEIIQEKSDEKIIKALIDKKLEINHQNIQSELSEKQKHYSEIISKRILNKVNNK